MEMTILQAVLCGIVYWLAVGNLPFVGLWSLQRPLVCGAITGLILGHPVQGAVIGATINLVYLGFMSAGGSMPADMGLAGVLGTAYAIVGGLDTDTALALAVPIGILGTIVWAGRMTFDCFFVHMADKYIEEEKYNKIWPDYCLPSRRSEAEHAPELLKLPLHLLCHLLGLVKLLLVYTPALYKLIKQLLRVLPPHLLHKLGKMGNHLHRIRHHCVLPPLSWHRVFHPSAGSAVPLQRKAAAQILR